MNIMNALSEDAVTEDLSSDSRDEVLRELAILAISELDGIEIDDLVDTLKAREDLGSTGIGGGIAIPHGKFRNLQSIKIAFGRSRRGVEFNAIDNKPVDLFFLLLAPDNAVGEHLKTLAKISRLLKNAGFCDELRNAATRKEIIDIIAREDAKP